jgi:hypothetical protein
MLQLEYGISPTDSCVQGWSLMLQWSELEISEGDWIMMTQCTNSSMDSNMNKLSGSDGNCKRWGLVVGSTRGMPLKDVCYSPYLAFYIFALPPILRPRSNRTKRPWTKTSEAINQNKPFFLYAFCLWKFVTVMEIQQTPFILTPVFRSFSAWLLILFGLGLWQHSTSWQWDIVVEKDCSLHGGQKTERDKRP